MYIVIFFSLIAMLLAFLDSRGKLDKGMAIGFMLVTFLGCIHYDYGSDYMTYLQVYSNITTPKFNLQEVLNQTYSEFEVGWALLCWLFKPLGGFFVMVAALNVLQNCLVYKFIATHVKKSWWPLAVFIYLFSTDFYLLSFSMMRQELAMVIFLSLWGHIKNRKWLFSLIVLLLCTTIHKSAFILLPFAFWGFLPVNKGYVISIVYIATLFYLWLNSEILYNLLFFASESNETAMKYTSFYAQNEQGSLSIGIGFLINLIPFALSIMFLVRNPKGGSHILDDKRMVALALISFLIAPFAQVIQLFGRMGMYFRIYSMGAIPLIYGSIEQKYLRIALLTIYCGLMMFDYLSFFTSDLWSATYTNFHTIFSLIV